MLAFENPFQVAMLKAGLKKSEWETSLKGVIISVAQRLPGWQGVFADRLVEMTMPKWDLLFAKFKIDALRSLAVQSSANDVDMYSSSRAGSAKYASRLAKSFSGSLLRQGRSEMGR
jgi:hypothetical protein